MRTARVFKHSLGATGADEMCNLYLMYYSYSKGDTFKVCFDEQVSGLNRNLPQGIDFIFETRWLCFEVSKLKILEPS